MNGKTRESVWVFVMLPSITSKIAGWCAGKDFDEFNAQLCVVSVGFDVEGIAANLIRRALVGSSSLHSCISCVVLPDGTKNDVFLRVASAISSSLNNNNNNNSAEKKDNGGGGSSSEHVQVHVAEEGTSTRTRCTYYQSGGVVVLSSRTLCADLLHRRLSRELVGIAIVLLPYGGTRRSDSVVPSIAFCAEILLRGGNSSGVVQVLSRRRHPPFIILSDNPCFVRYLLQRRRIGQEPFLTRVHVDDVVLFPRFRLDVMQHFEQLAVKQPLKVERVAVGVSPSVVALEGLLSQVIKEVVAELHGLETRLDPKASPYNNNNNDNSNNSSYRNNNNNNNNNNDDEDGYVRLQPIPRRARLEKQPPRYVRKPWVVPSDPTVIHFGCIHENDALDIVDFSLDDDLDYALRTHGPFWPFANLVESLLDVRRLRRDLRRLSPFAWLFALETALTARTARRPRDATSMSRFIPQPPDALWTLSQHFSSIVTLAIHRVGTVEMTTVRKKKETNNNNSGNYIPNMNTIGTHVVVEDVDDDDDDDDVVCVETEPPLPQRLLLPRSDEVDPCMEYAVRVVQGWCRDAARRRRKPPAAAADADGTDSVFLLIVFGERALRRYVCRITHSLDDFQTFELNGFVAAYQARHAGEICRGTEPQKREKVTTANLRTWFSLSTNVEEEENNNNDDTSGKRTDDAYEERRQNNMSSQEPSFLFSQSQRTTCNSDDTAMLNSNNNNNNNGIAEDSPSLHQLLLSQSPLIPPSQEQQENVTHTCSSSSWSLECVTNGIALLYASSTSATTTLRTAVVDGLLISASELIAMLNGSHNAFSAPTRLLVVEPQLRFLRLLEMAQDSLQPQRLRALRVQVLVEQLHESPLTDRLVVEEREAFEALAHAKATLTGSLLADHDTLRAVEATLESGLTHERRMGRDDGGIAALRRRGAGGTQTLAGGGGSANGRVSAFAAAAECDAPLVIFDEREFRSLLPYALYRRGIELVPLTLTTADYVLSPSYALERKSVPDFIQSLFSGRIYTQLAALSRRYEHPMCLIEFDRGAPFRLSFSSSSSFSTSSTAGYGPGGAKQVENTGGLFSRIARLFATYPHVHVLWSRDAAQSACIIHEMKRTCARESVYPSTPSLTRGSIDGNDSATEKETSHLAARVLSCFPGITPGNAPHVMAVCGSLAGLATIGKSALVKVMGEENANLLYTFLHDDLVAKVV